MNNHIDVPILSIAIPTFNGAKTICALLDRLLPQITDDVELIISDNASTDDTENIIKSYNNSGIISYHRNDRNIGPDANFFQCMQFARGHFILLLSDDDILIENKLIHIVEFLKKKYGFIFGIS